jgi:hypothetical protein
MRQSQRIRGDFGSQPFSAAVVPGRNIPFYSRYAAWAFRVRSVVIRELALQYQLESAENLKISSASRFNFSLL